MGASLSILLRMQACFFGLLALDQSLPQETAEQHRSAYRVHRQGCRPVWPRDFPHSACVGPSAKQIAGWLAGTRAPQLDLCCSTPDQAARLLTC